MNRHVIIVAGGKGLRMGGDIPKQFLPVGGKPVLMRTIEAFYAFDSSIHIILVLPVSQQAYWKDLCETYHFALRHDIADGGETRFHSVKNGLAYVKGEGLVGVHDGVRPFVSREVIAGCYEAAQTKQAVIPVIDVVETVRHLTKPGSETVPRNDYKLVQTPQVFEVQLLKEAYQQEYTDAFTDDASVVEAMGRADQEQHQAEFAENLQCGGRDAEVDAAHVAEVAEDERDDQRAARVAEREARAVEARTGQRDLDPLTAVILVSSFQENVKYFPVIGCRNDNCAAHKAIAPRGPCTFAPP